MITDCGVLSITRSLISIIVRMALRSDSDSEAGIPPDKTSAFGRKSAGRMNSAFEFVGPDILKTD